MADNKFTIEVNVTDNGTGAKAEVSLKRVGAAADGVNKSHKGATKAASDFYDTQNKGIIGTANSTKSFSKLAETLGTGSSSGLVAAYATMAANVFAVSAAFNALRNASQVEQIFKGLEAAGSRTGQALTVTADKLREVTGNTVDMQQALRSTAQITSSGFGADTVLKLGQAAKDASFALGRNMVDSLDRLTRGVVKLEPELLDELGVFTKLNDSNTQYAAKLGKSESQLTTFEKRAGFTTAVLAELNLKFGGLSDSAGDSTAYDKLASTLSNLMNTTLNVLNKAFLPLAGILASSPTALLGIITILASSIGSKLLPQLANAAVNAQKNIELSQQSANALRKETIEIIAKAKAQEASAAAALKISRLSTPGPRKFEENVQDINDNTATEKQKAAARNSLKSSINLNQSLLDNHSSYQGPENAAAAAAKALRITELKDELARLDELDAHRTRVANNDIERQAVSRRAILLTYAARKEAASAEAAAAAIGAASELKLGTAIDQVTTATYKYAQALAIRTAAAREAQEQENIRINSAPEVEAGPAAPSPIFETIKTNLGAVKDSFSKAFAAFKTPDLTGLDRLKIATFAVSTAAKTMGTAFLAAIPYIGQAIFVISLVKSGLDYLKPDSVKKVEKAFEDFTAVVESTDKSIQALVRTQTSTASLFLRTSQAITIQSNSIAALVESYNEVIAKQDDVSKQAEGQSGKATFFSSVFNFSSVDDARKEVDSYITGLDRDSEALKAAHNKLGGNLLGGQDKGVQAAAETLDKLSKIAPEATAQLVSFQGGYQNLTKVNAKTFISDVKAIADGVNKNYLEAAQNVASLMDAFKNLNQAVGEWAIASQQSTPFDGVVKNFQSVTNTIDKFQVSSAKLGKVDASKYKDLLTNVGGNTEKFLTTGTKTQLDALNVQNDKVQELKAAQAAASDDQKSAYTKLISQAEALRDRQTGVLDVIKSELLAENARFELAQQQTRELKSQETLLQANLTANQANYAASAQGVLDRNKAENAIKENQIAQLRIQEGLVKGYIAQADAERQRLASQNESLKLLLGYNAGLSHQDLLQQRLLAGAKQKGLIDSLNAYNQKTGKTTTAQELTFSPAFAYGDAKYASFRKQLLDTQQTITNLDTVLANDSSITAADQAMKGYKSSLTAINDSVQAVIISEKTAGQAAAEAAALQTKLDNERLGNLIEQRNQLLDINDIYAKTSDLLDNANDKLDTQLKLIQTSASRQKAAAIDSRNTKVSDLQAQLVSAQADKDLPDSAPRISQLQDQIALQRQGLDIDLQAVDAATQYSVLEKVIFDQGKEGLTWQQDALGYVQKELDAQRSLSETLQAQTKLRTEIDLKRRGLTISDNGTAAQEINAALESYKLALAESAVKKSLIDLEYALLDAQRKDLQENLEIRRRELTNTDGTAKAGQEDRVAQLSATINTLQNIDVNAIATTLKKNLDESNKNLRLAVESAAVIRPGRLNNTQSELEGIVARRRTANEARANLATIRESTISPIVTATPKVKVIANAGADVTKAGKPEDSAITPQIKSTNALVSKLDELIHVLQTKLQVPRDDSAQATGVNPTANAVAKQIVTFFSLHGFTTNQAAGIAGNVAQESGYDPTKVNKAGKQGTHAGLFQLNENYQQDFLAKYGHSVIKGTVEEQLEFVNKQLNGTEGAAKKLLLAANSVADAAVAFRKGYERPGDPEANDANRIAQAKKSVTLGAEKAETSVTVKVAAANDNTALDKEPDDVVVTGTKLPKKISSALGNAKIDASNIDYTAGVPKIEQDIPNLDKTQDTLAAFDKLTEGTIKNMREISPQGAAFADLASGFSQVGQLGVEAFKTISDSSATFSDKFSAAADVAQAALGAIQSAVANSAKSKEDGIDREIAAEEKRDGKSAQSQKKIAALQAQKDDVAKKAFETNKKLMMAQAVISTATGVAMALGQGGIFGIPLAIAIGAMGLAEVAIIAGTSYQSTAPANTVTQPSTLTIGQQGSTVDLAKQNNSPGGELGYLRGTPGTGGNASNYTVVGSAYGGDMPRGYGNTSYIVGEKGPERITPQTPITVTPANDNGGGSTHATFHINAVDADGVQDLLVKQKGNIISMIREAANANGQQFLPNVSVSTYTRPNSANKL